MSVDNQFALLREKRFGPFFVTQFLGAFNDNVFKNTLVLLIAFHLTTAIGSDTLINLAAGLFILPFFLFSATAGQLADKYDKAVLMRRIKFAEIVIMLAGAVGLYLGNVTLLLATLFAMGTQSAFFGPAKYGILPQHLEPSELVGGNGIVESGTFLAILLGTIAGGVLVSMGDTGRLAACIVVVLIAVAGYLASRSIPTAAATDPGLEPGFTVIRPTMRILADLAANRTVLLSVLGISWFWFFGAVMLAQFPNYTARTLAGGPGIATLLLTAFSAGIGVGSLLCERIGRRRIELGLVPLGAAGMTIFGIDLSFAHHSVGDASGIAAMLADPGSWRLLVDLTLLSMSGGIYIVPLYATVQSRSDPRIRSRVIAANNVLNALFMVGAALLSIVLLGAGLTIPQLFLTVALMNVAVTVFIFLKVPEFTVRLLIWLLLHTVYRLSERGMDNVPETGAALVTCNHVTLVDALIIAAAVRRPVRFVMDRGIFEKPVLNFIFRNARAIPICSAREDPELLRRAYDEIASALGKGELVCLFPEGRLTPDGEIHRFKNGMTRILKTTPVPVVPMALCGLWGSFFSRKDGPAMGGFKTRLFARIELVAAEPVAASRATPGRIEAIVRELRGDRR